MSVVGGLRTILCRFLTGDLGHGLSRVRGVGVRAERPVLAAGCGRGRLVVSTIRGAVALVGLLVTQIGGVVAKITGLITEIPGVVPLVGCEVADVTRFVAFFTRDITPIPGVVTSIRSVLS